ncbi:MAG: hypothetical protein CVV02_18300 [Firmicutes bacterium HGW-Firmicutes-7]|nr:MAG: hypothetical protein CVV02_18300 [Firmicutes bacterium HGW-Firmicutes-7]
MQMFRLKNKIIDKGRIVGYTLETNDNETTKIKLSELPLYIDNIQNGKLRNGYLEITNIRATDIPSVKLNNKKKNSRKYTTGYLKWENTEVGVIYENSTLIMTSPKLNPIVAVITQGKKQWNSSEYIEFLSDRVISNNRRDIEKILFRLGISMYDIFKIVELTYALNPKDLFWVAPNKEMRFTDAIKGTFTNIFRQSLNERGSSVNSPDGQNIKSYAISHDRYGIAKKRLNNLMTDAESEVAVYKLGELLGIEVCPAWFIDEDTIFSEFVYDFSREYMVHARRYFKDGERTDDLYNDLITKFPLFKKEIAKMCILDFITRQDDRHLSNLAIVTKGTHSRMYPLYDNGRSLFYDENEETVNKAVNDIRMYSTSFGEVGTYYDVVEEIARTLGIGNLVNLNITEEAILVLLKDSGFKGYRLEGNLKWIMGTLRILKLL